MAILDFWDSQDPKNRVSKKRIFEPIGPRERVYLRFLRFLEPLFGLLGLTDLTNLCISGQHRPN